MKLVAIAKPDQGDGTVEIYGAGQLCAVKVSDIPHKKFKSALAPKKYVQALKLDGDKGHAFPWMGKFVQAKSLEGKNVVEVHVDKYVDQLDPAKHL
jgi:hypothetical protein